MKSLTNVSGVTHLGTAGLGDAEAFDFRQAMSGDTYHLRIPRRDEPRSDFETSMRIIDDVVLSDFRSTPLVRARDVRSVRRDARPYVKVRKYVFGGGHLVIPNEASFNLMTGDINILDQSREFTETCRGGHQYNLLVSHEQIGFDPAKHGACVGFSLQTSAGKLLDTAFVDLFQCLADADFEVLTQATGNMVTLLRTLLEGGAETGLESTVVSARMQTVRRFVLENLSHPDLKPSKVIRHVGFSRATVYRDFADHGGLERFITRMRLQRGFDMLCRTETLRGAVDQVAEEVGFNSIHHFSKAFHRHFGLRPSDVIGLLSPHQEIKKSTNLTGFSSLIHEGKLVFDVARGVAA